MTVETKVASIVDRLRKVSHKNFPQLPTDYLAFGASFANIESFEAERPFKLPEDVKEYLQCVNGEGTHPDTTRSGLLLGCSVLSLDDIKREMDIWDQVMRENPELSEGWESKSFPPESIQEVYCSPKSWVGPANDGCGNSFAVDLAPGTKGIFGQVIVFGRDYVDKCVVANSWTEFLDKCVSCIERGEGFTVDGDFYELDDSGTYMDVIYESKVSEIREKFNLDY
jgi:cell wall assembly regulator SMI1